MDIMHREDWSGKRKDDVREVGVGVERGEERQAFRWLLGRKLAWSSERGR